MPTTPLTMPLVPEFAAGDVQVLERETVYKGFYRMERLQLRHRKFAGDWTPALRRELMVRRDAAGVLLYDPQLDAVALIEQFRVGAMDSAASDGGSPWLFELVAGLIDTDETPAQVARREALEEAGCEVLALEPVFELFSSPGGSNEFMHIFCGRSDLGNAGGLHGLPEEHEDIRVHVVAFAAAVALMQRGGLRNAHTIIALQWLQLNRERLRATWR
jgi:ADP-ribose pyrophosphatase